MPMVINNARVVMELDETIHQGDFYEPLALYADILRAQGLRPAEPDAQDYAPAWCSWGYEFDVRPEEVVGVIPKLKDWWYPLARRSGGARAGPGVAWS